MPRCQTVGHSGSWNTTISVSSTPDGANGCIKDNGNSVWNLFTHNHLFRSTRDIVPRDLVALKCHNSVLIKPFCNHGTCNVCIVGGDTTPALRTADQWANGLHSCRRDDPVNPSTWQILWLHLVCTRMRLPWKKLYPTLYLKWSAAIVGALLFPICISLYHSRYSCCFEWIELWRSAPSSV